MKKKYQGRKVSEYYKSHRKRYCFFIRGIYSLCLPLIIAMWLVPIYERMHSQTDRLTSLKNDWSDQYPLIDLKIVDA